MEEIKKNKALSDEELEQVSGGFTDHGDGTYSFRAGDYFMYESPYTNSIYSYTVLRDYDHLTLDDKVYCEYFHEMNGTLFNTSRSNYPVQEVLRLY